MGSENGRILRENLQKYFNETELKVLVFDLNIDPNSLIQKNLSEFVLSILYACARQELISNLLAYCREKRPLIQWPDLNADELIAFVDSQPSNLNVQIIQKAKGENVAQATHDGIASVNVEHFPKPKIKRNKKNK